MRSSYYISFEVLFEGKCLMSSVHVMTGATSGLGLEAARRLARKSNDLIIAGARRPEIAVALKQAVPEGRLVVLPLDTSLQSSVRNFVQAVNEHVGSQKISSVLCIAGLQILGPQQMTEDGIDATFATNVLGHILLVDGLRDQLEDGAIVVTVGSGTHDPANRIASRAGFLGADYTGAHGAAKAQSTRPARDQIKLALDRYATSKLCAIYHAAAAATEEGFSHVRFCCFDPGLMPGTALARDRGAAANLAWKYVMPVLRHFIEGVSSPTQSANMLIDGIVMGGERHLSGVHVEFSGKPAPTSKEAGDLDAAKAFLQDARILLKPRAS
jgi:NAD(P)-dependent dehydrogenase (short-subunit alcohol dehydrogenase family)